MGCIQIVLKSIKGYLLVFNEWRTRSEKCIGCVEKYIKVQGFSNTFKRQHIQRVLSKTFTKSCEYVILIQYTCVHFQLHNLLNVSLKKNQLSNFKLCLVVCFNKIFFNKIP